MVAAGAIVFMSFALVGLAIGLGARYPRFDAETSTQVAGSYGGVAFMMQAVLFIIVMIALLGWPSSVYLWYRYRSIPLPPARVAFMALSYLTAAVLALAVFLSAMRKGVAALEALGD